MFHPEIPDLAAFPSPELSAIKDTQVGVITRTDQEKFLQKSYKGS